MGAIYLLLAVPLHLITTVHGLNASGERVSHLQANDPWLTAVLFVLYAVSLVCRGGKHNGQTLGKQATGMRVIRNDGQPITIGTALLREGLCKELPGLLGGFFLLLPLIDDLWPLPDGQNRAVHDFIARTHVVQSRREPVPRKHGGLALVAGIAGVAVVGAIAFATLTPADRNANTTRARDSEAKALARNAEIAVETYATNNNGSFAGTTPAKLKEMAPSVVVCPASPGESCVSHAEGTETTFTLTVTAADGLTPPNTFTIEQDGGYPAPIQRCTTENTGGCPSGSQWMSAQISATAGRRPSHPRTYPSCGTAAFEPPVSRQGLCTINEGSGIVVRNIVDRNRILHMPEYDARIITWRIAPTHVSNWREEPAGLYPEGRGALVSLKVEIANPGGRPLQYGPRTVRSSAPGYRPHRPAELILPISAGPDKDAGVAALLDPRGAPGPSLFGQPPIQPHASITGWISFVTPPDAGSLVGAPRSDLALSPVDGKQNYEGTIRLWKSAGA